MHNMISLKSVKLPSCYIQRCNRLAILFEQNQISNSTIQYAKKMNIQLEMTICLHNFFHNYKMGNILDFVFLQNYFNKFFY